MFTILPRPFTGSMLAATLLAFSRLAAADVTDPAGPLETFRQLPNWKVAPFTVVLTKRSGGQDLEPSYRLGIGENTCFVEPIKRNATNQSQWIRAGSLVGVSFDHTWALGEATVMISDRSRDIFDLQNSPRNNPNVAATDAVRNAIPVFTSLGVGHALPGTFRWISPRDFEATGRERPDGKGSWGRIVGAITEFDTNGVHSLEYSLPAQPNRSYRVRYEYNAGFPAGIPHRITRYIVEGGKTSELETYSLEDFRPATNSAVMAHGFVPSMLDDGRIRSKTYIFSNEVPFVVTEGQTIKPLPQPAYSPAGRYRIPMAVLGFLGFNLLLCAWMRARSIRKKQNQSPSSKLLIP